MFAVFFEFLSKIYLFQSSGINHKSLVKWIDLKE